VGGVDDLDAVDPLQIDRCDPEVGVPELARDDDQRDAVVSQLDGVGVAELVQREPTTDAGEDRAAVGCAGGGLLPVSSGGCAVGHAEQRSGAKAGAELKPQLEVGTRRSDPCRPRGGGRLSAPDKNPSAVAVEIGPGEVKRLADPQAGAPQDPDQRPEPGTVWPVASCTHDGDDLLDRRWVRRVAQALVARRAPLVVARRRGRRAAMATASYKTDSIAPSTGR
jgi:hypothetical protein